jgi:AcrR family transcriptional regulator
MSKRKADSKRENSRDKILEAATHLFGRRGYHATTIDDITQAAGITRGALYWHFSGKSDLLGAVVKRLKKDFLDRFIKETMAAGSHPMDRLWWTFKFNARFAVEHMDIVHCLRNLSLELSPAEDENVKAFFTILSKQRDFILNIIRDAQAKGDIRSDLKAEMLAALILATHDGILLQATAFKRILNGRELVWAFRQVMLAGMAADAKILHLGKSAGSREDTKAK